MPHCAREEDPFLIFNSPMFLHFAQKYASRIGATRKVHLKTKFSIFL